MDISHIYIYIYKYHYQYLYLYVNWIYIYIISSFLGFSASHDALKPRFQGALATTSTTVACRGSPLKCARRLDG